MQYLPATVPLGNFIVLQIIFTLFLLLQVKFLKSKEGVAMIQLGDNASCERAIKNINGCFVFGQKLLLG